MRAARRPPGAAHALVAMAVLRRTALAALALALALASATLVAAVSLEEFIPFGPDAGDEELDAWDDAQSAHLFNSKSFKLFRARYNSIVVNDNGFLFLGDFEYPTYWDDFDSYNPKAFPMAVTAGMIAPFWTDLGGGETGSDYEGGGQGGGQGGISRRAQVGPNPDRVYFSYRSQTGEDAEQLRGMLEPAGVADDFVPKFFFVATWYRYAGLNTDFHLRNTFQAVLAADEYASYIVFNYENIDYADGATFSGLGSEVQVGFDEGKVFGGRYYIHPTSWSANVLELNSTSNVGVPGRWVYRVDNYLHTEPTCNNVVLAGNFSGAMGAPAARIAQYNCDNDYWRPLAGGFNGAVHAVAYYRGYLYAGGEFTADASETTELRYFARWDGSAWSTVPGGVEGPVYTLAEYDDHLLVGGDFALVSIGTARLASWDGRRWRRLADTPPNGAVLAIVPFPTGEVLIGGEFDNINDNPIMYAAMMATEGQGYYFYFSSLMNVDGPVRTAAYVEMDDYTNFICLGGAFASATESVTVDAAGLACVQDGYESNLIFAPTVGAGANVINTMVALRDGVIVGGSFLVSEEPYVEGAVGLFNLTSMTMTVLGVADGPATAFRVANQALWVFGPFTQMNGTSAPSVTSFSFTNGWEALPGGEIDGGAVLATAVGYTFTVLMPPLPDEMYIAGNFTAAGGKAINHIMRSTSDGDGVGAWSSLGEGLEHNVYALVDYNGMLVAGSVKLEGDGYPVGGHVAFWDGNHWADLGNWPAQSQPSTLAVYEGVLYAGGYFPGIPSRRSEYPAVPGNVAYYNETSGEWIQMAGAPSGDVFALQVYDGLLLAGGDFWMNGDPGIGGLLAWDGETWGGFGVLTGFGSGYVTALLVANDVLYIGGVFSEVSLYYQNHGSTETFYVSHIIAWNGSAWDTLDGGPDLYEFYAAVLSMAWFQGRLYIAVDECISSGEQGFYPCVLSYHPEISNGPKWRESVALPASGIVYALRVIDDWLYIAGDFSNFGPDHLEPAGVARYNGVEYAVVGGTGGVNGPVYAILPTSDGEIVAAGAFTLVEYTNTESIGRFDRRRGADGVFARAFDGFRGRVNTLAWYNGFLLAGGDFSESKGWHYSEDLVRYSPEADDWVPLVNYFSAEIYTMYVAQDRLFVGGSFYGNKIGYGLAKYADGAWRILEEYPQGEVYALTEYTDPTGRTLLYVGGDFDGLTTFYSHYEGSKPDTRDYYGYDFYGIAAYDDDQGMWYGLEGGVSGAVYAFATFQDELWVGGDFWESSGLLRWNGSAWAESPTFLRPHGGVTALGVFAGIIYAAVQFEGYANAYVWALLRSDGVTPFAPVDAGLGGKVSLLYPMTDALIVGGDFGNHDGLLVQGFTRWSGEAWDPLDSVHGDLYSGNFYAFAKLNGKLFVGGDINSIGGVDVYNVAAYNGQTWQRLRGGLDGTVYTMAVFGDIVYMGGSFELAHHNASAYVESRYIVGWDDADGSWIPMPGIGSQNDVYVLAVYNGELYAGGRFYEINGVQTTSYVIRWTGTAWDTLDGAGPSGEVYSLVAIDGRLYAGGCFSTVNESSALPLAFWDGESWSFTPGDLYSWNGCVRAIARYQNEVYVAGSFSIYDGNSDIQRVARVVDDTWHPLDDSFYSEVSDLAVYQGTLYIGGDIYSVGSRHVSNLIAWNGAAWVLPALDVDAPVTRMFAADDGLYVAAQSMAIVGQHAVQQPLVYDGSTFRTIGDGLGATGRVYAVLAPRNTALVLPLIFCPETVEGNASWPETEASPDESLSVAVACLPTWEGTVQRYCEPDGTWTEIVGFCQGMQWRSVLDDAHNAYKTN